MGRVAGVVALLTAAVMTSACAASTSIPDAGPAPSTGTQSETGAVVPGAETDGAGGAVIAWTDTQLSDPVTGESFKISDFKGTPVLLHSFAVW